MPRPGALFPLLEFLNKGAHFSSMTGEKLSEFQVVAAVSAAQRNLGLHLGSFLLLQLRGRLHQIGCAGRVTGNAGTCGACARAA